MELSVKGPILIGVATLLLLTSCSRVEPESTQIRVLVNGEALRKDAAYYAKDQNVSLDEAVRRLELQDDIGKLSAKLENNEPNTFGGLWIQHKPEFKVVVNMTGSGEEVAEYARGTSFAELVEVRQVAKTLKQLEAEQQQADSAVRALGQLSESDINVFENRTELYTLDAVKLDAALDARSSVQVPNGVDVIEVPSLSSEEVNAYAGNAISRCTAGYTVIDGNGLRGITTAGHCNPGRTPTGTSNTPQYYGSTLIRMAGEWYSGVRDLQWHAASSLTFQPWARDNQPTSQGTAYYREMYDVENRPDQPLNALVCKYGQASGFTCGYIESKVYRPPNPTNATATYVKVTGNGANLSDGGDSGGPWYVGHQAYGIHSGGWSSGASEGDSYYMAINYVTDTGLRLILATP